MLKLSVYDRNTNEKVDINRKWILRNLYKPYRHRYLNYSQLFNVISRYYANAQLEKYIPSEYELNMIKENPKYAENIPEYYVKGYDKAVGDGFEEKMLNEFISGFNRADISIWKFINNTNKKYFVRYESEFA